LQVDTKGAPMQTH